MQNIKLLKIRGRPSVAVQPSMSSRFSRVCQHIISTEHAMTVEAQKYQNDQFWPIEGGGHIDCSAPGHN